MTHAVALRDLIHRQGGDCKAPAGHKSAIAACEVDRQSGRRQKAAGSGEWSQPGGLGTQPSRKGECSQD